MNQRDVGISAHAIDGTQKQSPILRVTKMIAKFI